MRVKKKITHCHLHGVSFQKYLNSRDLVEQNGKAVHIVGPVRVNFANAKYQRDDGRGWRF